MVIIAFPHDIYVNETTAPEDTNQLWLATLPKVKHNIYTDVLFSSGISANNLPKVFTTNMCEVYEFDTDAVVIRSYNSGSGLWKDISNGSEWEPPYYNSDRKGITITQVYDVKASDGTLEIM